MATPYGADTGLLHAAHVALDTGEYSTRVGECLEAELRHRAATATPAACSCGAGAAPLTSSYRAAGMHQRKHRGACVPPVGPTITRARNLSATYATKTGNKKEPRVCFARLQEGMRLAAQLLGRQMLYQLSYSRVF